MSTPTRAARLRTRVTAIAASGLIAGAGLLAGAPPASADVHRGVAGCFSWSYGDGISSVTVYWRNRCNDRRKLYIRYSLGWTYKTYTAVVGPKKKGHKKLQTASIMSITDGGRA